jgi:hypothetical protein
MPAIDEFEDWRWCDKCQDITIHKYTKDGKMECVVCKINKESEVIK